MTTSPPDVGKRMRLWSRICFFTGAGIWLIYAALALVANFTPNADLTLYLGLWLYLGLLPALLSGFAFLCLAGILRLILWGRQRAAS